MTTNRHCVRRYILPPKIKEEAVATEEEEGEERPYSNEDKIRRRKRILLASGKRRRRINKWPLNNVAINLANNVETIYILYLLIILVMAVILVNPLNASSVNSIESQGGGTEGSAGDEKVKLSVTQGKNEGKSSSFSGTESKVKSSKATYLAKKHVATAQVLTNCTRNNSSVDSRESLIQQSPWYCDFVHAESLLNPSCDRNCTWCNERSFFLSTTTKTTTKTTKTSSASKGTSSAVAATSAASSSFEITSGIAAVDSSSAVRSALKEDKNTFITVKGENGEEESIRMSKANSKCLAKNVNQLCSLSPSEREYSSSLHLPFCQRYSLKVLTNSSWITANYTTCQLILNSILDQDNLASKLSCQFDSLLARYNCQSGYSVKWNCPACSVSCNNLLLFFSFFFNFYF